MPNAQQLKWDRLPLTGNSEEFTLENDTPTRVWRSKLYQEWTVQLDYQGAAAGTVIVEGTSGKKADVNLATTQWAGNPEENRWETIGTATGNDRIDQNAEVYELVRLRGSGLTGTVNAVITARQFVK